MWWVMAIGMAVKYAGTFTSMALQYQQAKHQEEMAKHKADILRAQADEAIETRSLQARSEQEDSQRRLAKMEARYAKAGLSITGSPLYAMQEQAEIDEFNIQSKDRATQIWAHDREYEAELSEWSGKVAKKGAIWGMAGTLLQSVGGDIASMGMGGGGKTPSGGGGSQGAPAGAGYMAQSSYAPSQYTSGMSVQRQFSLAT
jgi:ATPase subunit of ABC transporter with duplicated ATPase domains